MADLQIVNAVIDLGTNTFNLLVAESSLPGTFRVLHEERLAVKMGRGGIHKEKLLPEAMERGLTALSLHEKNILKFGAANVRVIGTSAIRGAANRDEFIGQVRRQFGWEMEVIDGNREAEYIFRGMVTPFLLFRRNTLCWISAGEATNLSSLMESESYGKRVST